MPWALIAISAIQAGYAIYNSEQQQATAQNAETEGNVAANQNRNRLLREGLDKQRGASSGTLLGGSPLGQLDNSSATLLNTTGDTSTQKSLLGNNL